MKYGDLTLGQVEALLNILGGQKIAEDILSGKKVIRVEEAGQEKSESRRTTRECSRSQLAAWKKLYKKHFEINLDVSSIKSPERKDGFGRLIVVVQGLTLNQVYDVLVKSFPCWRYIDDLDAAITKNDRDPKNGAYAIWARDRQEADEELKNFSADQLAEQKHAGITLLERMLYELLYWNETGKHLDVANWTLCSGSRSSHGFVPSVFFDVSKVLVYWCNPGYANDFLRSRSAVSLAA